MRLRFNRQFEVGQIPICELQLNLQCRDEIIPIMTGIQYIFSDPKLKGELMDLG